MKQIAKSAKVLERLKAAFGPDADLNALAVYECVALTTLPLRKSGGIFKAARVSLSMLSEMASSVNAESIPLQLQHDGEPVPFGRFFYAEVIQDELVGLFAVDGINHPDIVSKLDSGVLDQVSVGFTMKRLTCSACGFDYMEPANQMSMWTLTCDEGHMVGQNGVHVFVDGLEQFLELSLVGKGASEGARIVGPSDAQLQQNEQFRIAASANPGVVALRLSPTVKEDPQMNAEQMAAFTAAVSGEATAKAALSVAEANLASASATVASLTAKVAELEALTGDNVALKEAADTAVAALTIEAKKVLTACGKGDQAVPTDVKALLAVIDENRAKFAAIIPPNGASSPPDTSHSAPAPASAAFRAPPTR